MGGAGQNDRSGGQSGAATEKFDDLGDGEDHVVRAPILDGFAIEKSANLQILGIGDFVGGDEAGAEGAESVEGLSATPLTSAGVFLPVTDTDIVRTGVACDIVERFRGGNVFTITSDDDGEFAFVVDAIARKVTWEKDDVHVRPPHGMTGLQGFFRGIDEAEVADLNTRASDLVGHLAEVAFQSWFEAFQLGLGGL